MKSFLILFVFSFQLAYSKPIVGYWISYANQLKFSNKFGIGFDGNYRSVKSGSITSSVKGQYTLRVGAHYYFKPDTAKFTFELGLGYALRQSAFPFPDPIGSQKLVMLSDLLHQEHIIWQQFALGIKISKQVTSNQRLRIEEIMGPTVNGMGDERLCLRYLSNSEFLLLKKSRILMPYLSIQDEIHLNIYAPKSVNKFLLAENRFTVNMGLRIKKHIRIEVGYLNWYLNNDYLNSNWYGNRISHSLQCQIIQSLNLFRK